MNEKNKLSKSVFFKYMTSSAGNDISIVEYGYEDFSKSKEKLKKFIKDDYLLHFVTKGQGIAEIGGITYKVHENELFFIPPKTPMNYYPDPQNPWKYFWFSFNGIKAKFISSRMLLSVSSPVCQVKNMSKIVKIMQNLMLQENPVSLDIHCLAAFYQCIAILTEERISVLPQKVGSKEEFVEKTIKFVENNYENCELKIEEISQHLHICHSYLCKIFKEIMTISVNRYLINYRLQKAGEQLSNTSFAIKEIADKVGFNDPLYFSRQFKLRYGICPSKYNSTSQTIEN